MGDAVIFQGPVVLNSSLLQELKEEALSASACFYFKNTQLCVFVSRVRFSLFSVSSTGTWDIKGGTTEADSSGNWSPVRGALLPTPLPWKPGVRSAPPTLTSNLMPIGLREVFPPTIGFILFYVGWGGDFIFPPRFCWIFFQRALALHRIASPLALCFWFGRCGQQRIKLKSRQAWSNNVLPGLCFFFVFFRDQEMCLRGALLACWVQPYYFICTIISCYNLLTLIVLFRNFLNRL